jgi:two-component system chemotaxis response regulator CheB
MFSALTQRGAEATLDALALGATDYFTKPAGEGGLDASLRVIQDQLIPQIKALFAVSRVQPATGASPSATLGSPSATGSGAGLQTPVRAARRLGPIEVVAIGTSTGGPNALAAVFRRLPADFPVPIVVVQHMPPMFTRLLAERLSAEFPVRVHEAESGNVLVPGHAWIAPGDYHMVVAKNGSHVRTQLHQDPPENSCRPAVDVLLRSVAQTYGPTCLAVILTGMGQDGLRGCEAVREAGGQILAQDEASSVVWGMPGSVTRAGLADQVLPLSEIGAEILRRVNQDRIT